MRNNNRQGELGMSKDGHKDKKGEDASHPEDKKNKSEAKSSGKSHASLDLERLKKTNATQAPRAAAAKDDSTGRGISRRQASAAGPKLDLKFAAIACVSSAFLALTTHIFGINAGLVLNDRFNLAYLFSQQLMGKMSQTLLMDMLGASPLSQPWLRASFIGDHGEYGLNFSWYHTVDVFWHAAGTAFIFLFVLTVARHLAHQDRLKVNPHHLACASALLFACHPLSCQTVTYLSARFSLLGTNNYFLCLNAFLLAVLTEHKIARACFAALALFTGAMSVWSNPESLTLPAVALLSLLLMKGPLSKWKQTAGEHPFFAGGCLALALLLPCLSFLGIQNTAAINLFLPTPDTACYLASQIKGMAFYYLRCFILPFGLSIDPPLVYARSAFSDPTVYAGLAILALLAFIGVKKIKEPILGLASALILLGFLPHAFMVQKDIVADWVAYLPLSGVSIFCAYGFCRYARKNDFRAALSFVITVLLFMGLSIYRNWQWGSNFTLWDSALTLRPKSALGRAMISLEYLKRGETDQALKQVNLALAYAPEMAASRLAQAKVLNAVGKNSQAYDMAKLALNLADAQNLDPAVKEECRLTQLQALIGMRKEKEAGEMLASLLKEMPEDPRIIYLVGMSAFTNGDFSRSYQLLERAVSVDPSLQECFGPMAESALALHASPQAVQAARNYLQAFPCLNAEILCARTLIYAKESGEAETLLKQVLQKDPRNARALYLLSRLYKLKGNSEDWRKYHSDAVKIDPDLVLKFALPELDELEKKEASGSATSSPERDK